MNFMFTLLLLFICSSAWAQTPGDSVLADYGLGLERVPGHLHKPQQGKRRFFYDILTMKPIKYASLDVHKGNVVKDSAIVVRGAIEDGSAYYLSYHLTVTDLLPRVRLRLNEYDRWVQPEDTGHWDNVATPNALELFGRIYNLDSLYWTAITSEYASLENVDIDAAYLFQHGDGLWLALYMNHYTTINVICYQAILLFNLDTQGEAAYIHLPQSQSTSSPLCFGDFNNNGKLDYALWNFDYRYAMDTLLVYELEDGAFRLLKDYYLVMKLPNWYKEEEIAFEDALAVIDLKRSRWFFDLSK